MSYHHKNSRRRGRALSGMGGVENCGADQVWDPNIEYFGSKGQCMPRKNYTAAQLENVNAFPTSVKSTTAAAPSSGGWLSTFLTALNPAPTAPMPSGPIYMPPASTSVMGLSTTTLALAGGAAVLLIVLATRN